MRPRTSGFLFLILAAALVSPTATCAREPASTPAGDAGDVRAALAHYLESAAAEGFTGAVLVARGGEVLLAEGYGLADPGDGVPVTADTVFTTGSITKQFTAAALLRLQEAGKLSVSDPIAEYLDGVPADKQAITIHHLLSHQAGFPGAIGDDREQVGRDEYLRRALATGLLFTPGEAYEYSNVGFSLAAAIVERVSGQSYEAFLRETLFLPAGMKDTGYVLPGWDPVRLAHGRTDDGGDWGTVVGNAFGETGPGWHLVGNGGIHSTVGDMYRWHQALQGDAILSADSKRLLYGKHADEGGGTWYGYGWSIEPTEWGEMITHNGGNRYYFADFLRFPEDDVVVYYTTTSRDRRMNRLGRALAKIVFTGERAQIEPAPAAMIAPGDAPPAVEGSLAAKWGFPGSHRGQRAGELLEAMVSTDAAWRRSFAETGFTPDLVARRGVDGLVGVFDQLREEAGDFKVQGVQPAGTNRVVIVLDAANFDVPMRLEVDLEPEAPHRIVSIAVEVGE